MLYKLGLLQYSNLIDIADAHDCGSVYPLSVACGIQEGDIFTNDVAGIHYEKVLFWTHCGFAYISGAVDEPFMEDIYQIMLDESKLNTKRFILMTKNEYVQDYFQQKNNVICEKRYLFEYSGDKECMEPLLPSGYELKEIDNQILNRISGKIVPSLFWRNVNDFLEKGKGYCITCDNDIASWAFSAAVSTRETDIGIETNSQYQQRGLGFIVARKMIQYVISQGKKPVWACHYKNAASEKMAEKLGFNKKTECSVIKRKYET